MIVVNASLIVSSFFQQEREHLKAKGFLNKLLQEDETILLPEIALPEIASAIARGTKEAVLAINFCRELRKFPNFVFRR
ncbi:hypothetical protein KJ636_05590 [Patescibacteria group bacterium]|nr:hypothetical protein [Patescibacteria group bacterium]MBU4481560.1 hypothetical protein [Patescibacteria group bacterium]